MQRDPPPQKKKQKTNKQINLQVYVQYRPEVAI